jgi:hypothetical protein
MKTKTLVYIAAGLIAIGAPALTLAEDSASTTTTNAAPAVKHQRGNMQEVLKAVGLLPADLKGLDKDARHAKLKEAVDKKLAELKAKKTAGTLTDQDKKDFAVIQKFESARHQDGAGAANAKQ